MENKNLTFPWAAKNKLRQLEKYLLSSFFKSRYDGHILKDRQSHDPPPVGNSVKSIYPDISAYKKTTLSFQAVSRCPM